MQQEDWWQATFPQGRQMVTITDAQGETVRIAYGEKGQGKPLILLHGWGTWSYAWKNNIDTLAAHYRVIVFDAKNYGFSDLSPKPELIGHQIIETIRIIQALVDEPVYLIAESLGGLIAVAVAAQKPDLIAGLVLINAAVFPEKLPNAGMQMITWMPMVVVTLFDRLRLIKPLAPFFRYILKKNQTEIRHNPIKAGGQGLFWISYPYIHVPGMVSKIVEDSKQAALEIRKMRRQQPNLLSTIQSGLNTVTAPTLIIWGAEDKWFPLSDGEKLRDLLPKATLQPIPNCGHHASGDCSEAVNQAITEFLVKI